MDSEASSGGHGLVVAGASLAGLRAVQAARRAGYDGPIVLLGAEEHLPYDRPPLSKEFLTGNSEPVYYLTETELREDLLVDLRLGQPATGLDTAARTVSAGGMHIPYRRLIIATGARPRQLGPALLGRARGLPGVRTLRTLDDAREIRQAIHPGSHLVIVGGGFIGAEIASSAGARGATVTIAEIAPVPLVRAVGEVVGRALSGLHSRNGTRLVCGVQVSEVLGTERAEGVRLSTGEVIRADLVIVGIGVVPATGWLAGSGIALSPADGAVLCDEYLRTSAPDVYAAGDVAHWPNGALDRAMRLENWTNASDQGTRAAVNALFPEQARAHETVPYFWSDWYGSRIQLVGTALADSVRFVSGGPDDEKFVALYRTGERLMGAATLNEPRKIMKFRRLIAGRGSWEAALELLSTMSEFRVGARQDGAASTMKMASL
jgi:NADPH-dependent 2,4-dienoyl-CoA reductase/sulfur reductase-like enzyme